MHLSYICSFWNWLHEGCVAHALSCKPDGMEARVQTQVSQSGICGRHSTTGTGFSQSTSAFPSVSFHQCSTFTQSFVYHRHYIVLAIDSLTIWSAQVLIQLSNSLHLIKLEDSLPCLLDPATGLHCQPGESSPCPTIPFLTINFNIILGI
jgi:hypothetical protein